MSDMTNDELREVLARKRTTKHITPGMKFGKLLTVDKSHQSKLGKWLWFCKCDCGGSKEVMACDLNRGHTTSCGCFRRENTSAMKTKHGHSKRGHHSPEHRAWCGIWTRTTNPNDEYFEDYGARGIRVCHRWEKFENFLSDMGIRPTNSHSIDRINNDGNYEPGN